MLMQESPGNGVALVGISAVRNRIFDSPIQSRLQKICLKRIANATLIFLFFLGRGRLFTPRDEIMVRAMQKPISAAVERSSSQVLFSIVSPVRL